MQLSAQGCGNIVAPGALFYLRERDGTPGSGIRLAAGDMRAKRPVQTAMLAPITYVFEDGAYRLQGRSHLHAAAVFLQPGEPPPPLADESTSLDVQANVAFDLQQKAQRRPVLHAAGTAALTPEGTEPFVYELEIAPGSTRFEAANA